MRKSKFTETQIISILQEHEPKRNLLILAYQKKNPAPLSLSQKFLMTCLKKKYCKKRESPLLELYNALVQETKQD